MKKKIIAFLLTLVFVAVNATPALATSQEKIASAESIALELKNMGVFVGTDKGFELERPANRAEAIIMLLRLMGKEKDALETERMTNPFTDVPEWAAPYVSYAYMCKLTLGISDTKFGSYDTINDKQFLTLMLRALGYTEYTNMLIINQNIRQNEVDFNWDNPYDLATKIGLIKSGEYPNNDNFTRADVAIFLYNALLQAPKRMNQPLRYYLTGDTKYWVNTLGKGDPTQAGSFRTDSSKLVTVNKEVTYQTNLSSLNSMIGNTYGLRYVPTMTKYGQENLGIELLHDSSNRYGLKVPCWRHSYDSNVAVNNMLNAALETFYFECGDKAVAYALWSWIDSMSINGKGNTNDFGFTDVSSSGNTGVITMNGIEIEATTGSNYVTVYFN